MKGERRMWWIDTIRERERERKKERKENMNERKNSHTVLS